MYVGTRVRACVNGREGVALELSDDDTDEEGATGPQSHKLCAAGVGVSTTAWVGDSVDGNVPCVPEGGACRSGGDIGTSELHGSLSEEEKGEQGGGGDSDGTSESEDSTARGAADMWRQKIVGGDL